MIRHRALNAEDGETSHYDAAGNAFALIVAFLRDECQLAHQFSEEEVTRCIGIMLTNAYENSDDQTEMQVTCDQIDL